MADDLKLVRTSLRSISRPGRLRPGCRARRGTVLIYSAIVFVVLFALGSLAVDFGRVQLAKSEMQSAIDAAGRAAVAYLPSDTSGARAQAISIAAMETVDGQPLVLQSGDIVFGKWNSTTKTLDTSSSTPDTVQISAQRSAARANAIPLSLARIIGINSFDLRLATTVLGGQGTRNYGILGLNSANFSSASYTGTYNSATGTSATGASSTDGDIASNGTINLSNDISIGGTIFYNTVSSPSGGSYYTAKTKMTTAASTPATPAAGAYTSSNSNPSLGLPTGGANATYSGSGTMSVGGGNYVLNTLSLTGITVQFTGPVTVWMYGNVTLNNSSILAYQNKPTNVQIKFCSSAGFNLNNSTVYGVVSAPTTPANINSSSRLYGSIVASGLSVVGSSILYDTQLGINGTGTGSGSTVVK